MRCSRRFGNPHSKDRKRAPGWGALLLPLGAMLGVFASVASAQDEPRDFVLAKVRILPRERNLAALAGVRVVGSNQGATSGFAGVGAPGAYSPGGDGWIEIPAPPGPVYRYLKIESGPGAKLALAEIEFHSASGKLAGAPFGTAVPKEIPDTFERAFDGDAATGFTATTEDAYVGIDLGAGAQCPTPRFEPKPGVYAEPQRVQISTWPGEPVIRYTTDGSVPSGAHGEIFGGPIPVETNTAFAAIAVQSGKADSTVAIASYAVGAQVAAMPLLTSYHIGNSLTDTVVGWMEPLCFSAGKNYRFLRKTIPGCGLEGNWESNGKGFGDSDYEKVLAAGVDHLFLQVFPNPPGLERDRQAGENFLRLARQGNPNAQVWLYAQWPAFHGWDRDAHCVGGGWMTPPWFPANRTPATWEEAMANKMEYYRAILDLWNRDKPAPPARLCPGGPALAALKAGIDAGRIPGMSDFAAEAFPSRHDTLHLSRKGAYLVSLVHFACMYGENPRGAATFAGSGLTAEQARMFQEIAWAAVQNEPASGVAGGGSH